MDSRALNLEVEFRGKQIFLISMGDSLFTELFGFHYRIRRIVIMPLLF